MSTFLPSSVQELIIWLSVFAIVVTATVYLVGKTRARSVQQELMTSELMSKFRELHSAGELSDAEFRTIRTTLAARMQQELKDNGETG